MNGLWNIDETYRKYSLAFTYDLVRFWRSKVNVTAGCQGGKGIHVGSGALRFIVWLFNDIISIIVVLI